MSGVIRCYVEWGRQLVAKACLSFVNKLGQEYYLVHVIYNQGLKVTHRIDVYEDNLNQTYVCYKEISISTTHLVVLERSYQVSPETVHEVILRYAFDYAVERMEIPNLENEEILITSNTPIIKKWINNKRCEFQDRNGSSIGCQLNDGLGDSRTTTSVCNNCGLPEIYYRCRHMVNILTRGVRGGGQVYRTVMYDCDKGEKPYKNCFLNDCRKPWILESQQLSGPNLVYSTSTREGKLVTVFNVNNANQINVAQDNATITAGDANQINNSGELKRMADEFLREAATEPLTEKQTRDIEEIRTLLETVIEQQIGRAHV